MKEPRSGLPFEKDAPAELEAKRRWGPPASSSRASSSPSAQASVSNLIDPKPRAAIEAQFSVQAGEFTVTVNVAAHAGITVLFGPSGAGKSMTLATIAGLRRPNAGTVIINNRVVADAATGFHMRTQDRNLGVVFQDSLLLPHRTVRDNVALAVRLGTRAERRKHADDLLNTVGATALAEASPARLSGGERQRIALARALAGKPHALLLDEPFSALDYLTRQALRELLRTLVDTTGVPTLLVTHDLDEAAQLADHTIRYVDGSTSQAQPGFAYPKATTLEAGNASHGDR